jgi:hypothetical protein
VAINSTNNRLGISVIVRDHLGYVIAASSQTNYFVFENVAKDFLSFKVGKCYDIFL